AEGERLLRLREPMLYTYQGRNRLVGSVELIMDLDDIDQTLKQLQLEFAKQAAVATGVSVIIMVILFRLLLRPMRKLVAAMNRLKEGDFELQVIASDPSEVGLLTRTFNNMAYELSLMQQRLVEQERLKRDLEIAETIQQGLLPGRVPDIPSTELSAHYASASNVGGDYFDVFQADDDVWALIVADVSGKGISGALGMTITRSILRSLIKSGLSPQQVLSQCNHTLYQDIPAGMFVTVALAYYYPSDGRMLFASAGHNPPLLLRGTEMYEVKRPGLPLGADDEGLFEDVIREGDFILESGDLFLMYTDGVTEAMDREGNMFGVERVRETLLHYSDSPVPNLATLLSRKVNDFRRGAEPNDDVTFIVMRREQGPS
ncbi:SpoIIE family protein phosphatase, partial [bacterium]|nr:SpoIIE family protein phosphatase [bacterium]